MITLTPLAYGILVAIPALCAGYLLGHLIGWICHGRFIKNFPAISVPSYLKNNMDGDIFNANVIKENIRRMRTSGREEAILKSTSPLVNERLDSYDDSDIYPTLRNAARDIEEDMCDADPLRMSTVSTKQFRAQESVEED